MGSLPRLEVANERDALFFAGRRGEVAAIYVQTPDNRLSLRQLRLGDAVGQGEMEVLAGIAAAVLFGGYLHLVSQSRDAEPAAC